MQVHADHVSSQWQMISVDRNYLDIQTPNNLINKLDSRMAKWLG